MEIYDHFNKHAKDSCPICKTKDDKPTILVGIEGTEKGNNMEAVQVHIECIHLTIADLYSRKVLGMVLPK